MKSTSGEHYIALDHIRALAAFMVFTWHFIHGMNGYPVPFEFTPLVFPLSILDEGHVGVALFMTLSGYLFAKLLHNKHINFAPFIWNRILRLLPLLVIVITIVGLMNYFRKGESLLAYAIWIAKGLLLPTFPNGGWSITVEFHFYIGLPILLWMTRRSKWLPISIIALAIAARTGIYILRGEAQIVGYWTIGGRIDQFIFGILAFHHRAFVKGRHSFVIACLAVFLAFYTFFDQIGGFYNLITYPSPSPLWILIPTIEGYFFATATAWYETSFKQTHGTISRFVARLGEYSYSIYLLHFFVVFSMADLINRYVMPISNFYICCLWSMVMFILMAIPGYLSYRYIESPFLKFRRRYTKPDFCHGPNIEMAQKLAQ